MNQFLLATDLHRGLRYLGAAGMSLLLTAIPGTAQSRDTVPPADSVFSVEPLLVTASRLPRASARLGLTVDTRVVEIADPPYVADLLRGLPGAFLDEAAGPGGPTIVRLRGGEEVFTQILMDGVQVNQNGGFFDFLGLTLSNLAAVDVARGPQSAVYGSSAVSGVVHFLTPRGRVGPPVVELRAEGGAASDHGGSWRTEGSVRGGGERLRYSAGAGAAFSRGVFERPHDTRSRDGSLRLDWAAGSGVEMTLTGRRVEMSSNLPVRDPGATRVPLDPNARNERDRTVAAVTLRHTPSATWSHHLRASRYDEDFVFEDEFDGVSVAPDAGFFVFDANLRYTSALVRDNVEVVGSYDSGKLRAAYGAQVEKERLRDHITGDFGGDPLVLERTSWATFGEVGWSATPSLTLGAGVRLERYEDLEAVATPRFTVTWSPGSAGLSLRAATGRAYKAPNLQQQYVDNPFIVANPDLQAETSTSWEAGIDARPSGAGWSAGITAFHQTFDDLIRTVAVDGDTRQINRNLGAASATGIEWQTRARLSGPWWLSSQGTLLRTEIVEATGLSPSEYPEGEGLPFRPWVTGVLTLAFQPQSGMAVSVSARGVGAQTVLSERFSGRRVELPSYVLVGFTAEREVRAGITTYVRVENLLGTDHETAFDRPGIPAVGSLGLAVRF